MTNLNFDSAPNSWTTSNAKVATISNDGVVQIVKKGSVKITALFGTGKNAAKYSFTLKVYQPTITKKKASILTGASINLQVKAGGKVMTTEWRSADESLAKVDENGKVTGIATGTVNIIGTYEGKTYTCAITVKSPKISATKATIKTNKTKKLTLKNTKLKATDITWSTSDSSIATVENGVVTGKSAGKATITVKAGGYEGSCVVTVK